jgi:hypothetical protein
MSHSHLAKFVLATGLVMLAASATDATEVAPPPAWEVLPIPRYADYGSPASFVLVGKAAIIRHDASPYHTIRDTAGELVGPSTITEEELTLAFRDSGVHSVTSLNDNLSSYDDYDTLILLGSPNNNSQTAKYFEKMELSFDNWNDPNTPEDDFTDWKDLGKEGYILKVGRADGRNIVILAGYDQDDSRGTFYGAGTFYAFQSLRQLIVSDGETIRIKTAEIVDRPLVAERGYMTGWDGDGGGQLRDVAQLARMKANNNVYWYGNGGYNPESASRWRYPWTAEQLAYFSRVGKYCREHFITMNFCMNPDHYERDWAAAKTFDGSRKDPIHYDPNHGVEPEFKKMWAKLGYEVNSDADIIASKYGQLHAIIPGTFARLQLWNEDDVFTLVHPADKTLFQTDTADPKQNSVNYGRARGLLLARIYKRIKERYPDSPDSMPICPPAQLHYHYCFENNDQFCREFMTSLGETLQQEGVLKHIPCTDSGGGCSPEVLPADRMADFQNWYAGGPILLHDDNFDLGRIGAYETNPNGPKSQLQLHETLPAGYRDQQLYRLLWGMTKNGGIDGARILCWCQAQYMWNMLALDREKVNSLAVRKETTEQSYPLLKQLCEEFSRPVCYTLDTQEPYRRLVISDKVTFPSGDWQYQITFADETRLECQRLRDKLNRWLPEIEATWENASEKAAMLPGVPCRAASFCSVYLAYGYIHGWLGQGGMAEDVLEGTRLRDLLLEADDIQERFFAGPDAAEGRITVSPSFYTGTLYYIYTQGKWKSATLTRADADFYIDIWNDGLLGKFFDPVLSVIPAELPDGDARLSGGWGKLETTGDEPFRTITKEASIKLETPENGRLLVRAKLGTSATPILGGGIYASPTEETTQITFSTGEVSGEDVVCRPRWLSWFLPAGKALPQLVIKAENPVHVYAIEVYSEGN